jgi:hypothetical protein
VEEPADPPPEEGPEIPVCGRCFRPYEDAPTYCRHCGMPLSYVATAGPFEAEVGMWSALGDAARSPSRSVFPRWVVLTTVLVWSVMVAVTAIPLFIAIWARGAWVRAHAPPPPPPTSV